MTGSAEKVLLFYDGFEMKAIDAPFGAAASGARGLARYAYRTLRGRQPYTGYYTALMNLVRSLKAQGLTVHVNDFREARKDPSHPIALCGYRSVFDRVRLPNPALVFHADFGYPDEVDEITGGVDAKLFALGCPWSCTLYRDYLGDRIRPLFIAIDTEAWPDLSAGEKTVDYLIYDKIRWRREDRVPELHGALTAELDAMGRSHETLRYGHHHLGQYKQALARSQAMIFLCEHETQGIAYQEAMSSNLPIFAWDEGELVDPKQRLFFPDDQRVSAVPYFDETCGVTFSAAGGPAALHDFDKKRLTFQPRSYVENKLNFEAGANAFLRLYEEVGSQRY
ncbi:MAG: hypothetical protein AAF360_03045 [Pseudomonadota bacterium]